MGKIKSIVFVFMLIVVVVISGCTENTDNGQQDCNYYCSQEGYGEAVSGSCVPFAECNDPNMPITADICEGVELCCCTP